MSNLTFEGRPFRGRDLTGQKFGRLTILRIGAITKHPCCTKTHWLCLCECGKSSLVFMGNLISGHTLSCGCYKMQRISESHTTHGGSRNGKWELLLGVWKAMKARCNNPNCAAYKHYGGRGIKLCERWSDYAVFRADMLSTWSKGLKIERRDNDGPYSRENCFWATQQVQMNNTRSNLRLMLNGLTLTAAQWARQLGWISARTIYVRKDRGWSDERTLTQPLRVSRPRYA